ncbi:hypothetical protein ACFLZ9_01895, partial [Patescibacteria group bacterium]
VFNIGNKRIYLTPSMSSYKIIDLIPAQLLKNRNTRLTQRNTIVYGREGQRIWREIVVLSQ